MHKIISSSTTALICYCPVPIMTKYRQKLMHVRTRFDEIDRSFLCCFEIHYKVLFHWWYVKYLILKHLLQIKVPDNLTI